MGAKLILMMAQSNTKGNAAMATLPGGYSSDYSTIKVWNGSSGFLNMNSGTNTNQWPEKNNCFGIEYKLGTLLQAHYSDTIYITKPAWGSHGLQNGSGSSGTYDPSQRGTTPKYDVGIAAYNESYNSLFQTNKNNIDILAFVYIGMEADAKSPYDTTQETALTNFFNKIRGATGRPNLPIIACRLSSSVDPAVFPKRAEVNTALENVATAMSRVHTINTDACALQVDLTHYTAAGYDSIGQLVYDCMDTNGYLI